MGRVKSDKFWKEIPKRNWVASSVPVERKLKRVPPDISHVPMHKRSPEGVKEELQLAYDLANEYLYKIMSYAPDNSLDKESLAFHRRFFHFIKHGPKRGYFTVSDKSKLTNPDVLYILSCKHSKQRLSKLFNVAEGTIQRIRAGESGEWKEEFNLVKMIRNAVYSNHKKYLKDDYVNVLIDGKSKDILAVFPSNKKARTYRKNYLRYKKNMTEKSIMKITQNTEIENLYPIIEQQVFQED